jgi:hypothetical protein
VSASLNGFGTQEAGERSNRDPWAPHGFCSLANRAGKDLDTYTLVQYTFKVTPAAKWMNEASKRPPQ